MFIPDCTSSGFFAGENGAFIPECTEHHFIPPPAKCTDCDDLEERLAAVENMLEGKGDIEISKTDINGDTVTLTIIGAVS